ncbi:hypothetical protein DRO91_06555, partial [Candidatus Heimdallarchaeota archaeon]
NMRKESKVSYLRLYWHKCGFCTAAERTDYLAFCGECNLNVETPEGDFVCDDKEISVARRCLRLADVGKFNQALPLAEIVLDRIKNTGVEARI